MTDQNPSPATPTPTGKVNRDTRFMIRFSRDEKQRLDAAARAGGFDNVTDYIRHRLFRETTDGDLREHQKIDGDLFTDKQKGELAVAVLHQYRISEKAFEQQDGKDLFDAERRRTINILGLRRLLGSGS